MNKPKNYKGGADCAYCGKYDSSPQKEHVFGRTLFSSIGGSFQNPILIPCCAKCNNMKSKYEAYTSVIFTLASDHELSPKQMRGISHLSKEQKEKLFSGRREYINVNGVLQDMWIGNIDWGTIENLSGYIAKGILYEHNGNVPVETAYTLRTVKAMPVETEFDIAIVNNFVASTEPSRIFLDENRYDGKIKYALLIGDEKALVYFQMFNPLMGNYREQKQYRVIAAVFDKNA